MFLGTPRRWWIAAALLFVAALALIGADTAGTLGDVVGVLLLLASIAVFGMSPMRYGQRSREPTTAPPSPPREGSPAAASVPPESRPRIDARDPGDV